MTRSKHTPKQASLQEVLKQDGDLVRALVAQAVQQVLEAEMDEAWHLSRKLYLQWSCGA